MASRHRGLRRFASLDDREEAARLLYDRPKTAGPIPDAEQAARLADDRFRAARLFDWTVRNIQLERDESPRQRVPRQPWQVLLLGRGTAIERAWVFMLLARQQQLDVVLLATPDRQTAGQWHLWLPAQLVEGQLYLFDTELGLAVPGPKGHGVATLEQAASDGSLLRRLDAANRPYPVPPPISRRCSPWSRPTTAICRGA